MSRRFFSALLVLAFTTQLQAATTHKDRLNNELDVIAQMFGRFYAPKEWKEKYVKWNLDQQLTTAQETVKNAQSVVEYRQALVDLLNSTADYHVGYRFQSTAKSSLPFFTKFLNGKTMVVWIDRTKLPKDRYDLAEGDELISMNDTAISDIYVQLKKVIGQNVAGTDQSLADLTLTTRSGQKNYVLPTGPVTLVFKKPKEEKTRQIQIIWDHTPESVPGETFKIRPASEVATKKLNLELPQMTSMWAQDFKEEINPFGIGLRKSYLPDLGARIWETAPDSPFDAYIFQNEQGKLIGVVRIPSYTPDNAEKSTDAFRDIIKKMQATTSGLIIDQLNNPGGSVFYLYALASMLHDQPLKTPRHKMSIETGRVKACVEAINELKDVKDDQKAQEVIGKRMDGYPVTYHLAKMLQNFCEFYASEWKSGKTMTDSYFLWGVDLIHPSPEARYTKPVMILVNELDFSGGDFFPAILQDNKRATIVGTRTAGAGGYVLRVSFPNVFGFDAFSYTGSIAERVDRNPIENLGVTPDFILAPTAEDYSTQFKTYTKSVLEKMKELLN